MDNALDTFGTGARGRKNTVVCEECKTQGIEFLSCDSELACLCSTYVGTGDLDSSVSRRAALELI